MIENLRQSFQALNARERIMVSGGLMILLIIGLYLFVWDPIVEKQRDLNVSIASQKATYQRMLKSAAEARQYKGSGARVNLNIRALQSIINRTAKSALPGALVKQVKKAPKETVLVLIDQTSFDDVIKWLGTLQQTKGVRIISFFSERTDQVGRVNVRLTLKAS